MANLYDIKRFMICFLILSLIFSSFSTSIVVVQAEPPMGIKEKLLDISKEEKQILQNLFTLAQDIEIMEQEEEDLTKEIEVINSEIKGIEASIAEEEISYEKKQEGLRQVLRSYQRMGPGSYLEIIMNSDSLTTFLRRLNTLRDFTRNTGKLLEQLNDSREKLTAEKKLMSEKLALIKEKQKQVQEALIKQQKLKLEKEQYLASLKEEGEYYQEQLNNIQRMMTAVKPILTQAEEEFSHIVEKGSLPMDAFKITISLLSIKGSIDEKAFNEIIAKQTKLPKMEFAFKQDKIEVSLPEQSLILVGNFVIEENHILRFKAEEGSFYGLPLELGFIDELFSDGGLALDFKPILGKNTLQSIKVQDGNMELTIKLSLF